MVFDFYITKGEHNDAYDHEAFLGDEAEQFASLTPEEARVKLALVVDKIDQDNDTLVTEAELTRWIKETAQRSVDRRTEEFWRRNNPGGESEISWDKYRAIQYGFLTDSHITDEGGRWIFYYFFVGNSSYLVQIYYFIFLPT